MGPQIIVSAHAPFEIPKPQKMGPHEVCSFRRRSLFWGFEWNERSNIPKKNNIRGIEVSLNILCDWLQARKHVKNERT